MKREWRLGAESTCLEDSYSSHTYSFVFPFPVTLFNGAEQLLKPGLSMHVGLQFPLFPCHSDLEGWRSLVQHSQQTLVCGRLILTFKRLGTHSVACWHLWKNSSVDLVNGMQHYGFPCIYLLGPIKRQVYSGSVHCIHPPVVPSVAGSWQQKIQLANFSTAVWDQLNL